MPTFSPSGQDFHEGSLAENDQPFSCVRADGFVLYDSEQHQHQLGKSVSSPKARRLISYMRSWGLAKDARVARFIEPMECLPVEKIPEGNLWTYELKLDGYRIEAVKSGGKITLYSRRGTDLSQRFRYVTSALAMLPDETVIDGEIVALDEQGKPNFNLLQNFRSSESHIMLYAFDVLARKGKDLTKTILSKRREILADTIKPHDHVGIFAGIQPDPERHAHLREESRPGRNHREAGRQHI
jgi:bifunctional non-homologous end joining protein LigD